MSNIPTGQEQRLARKKGASRMEKIIIAGGRPLRGTVPISGSKNSTLALMAAALVAEGTTVLENIPFISDTFAMAEVLRSIGAEVVFHENHSVSIDAGSIGTGEIPYEVAKRMRGSIYVLGPLLARCGRGRIPLPGGCDIGSRPIDLHQKGLQALGAEFTNEHGYAQHGYVSARTSGLQGTSISLRFPSAGATLHLMTTAALADGVTVIENVAAEPEVVDLANLLTAMGAPVHGAGTHTISIDGARNLQGVRHTVIPDRLEAGTYLCAGAITAGEVKVTGCRVDHLHLILPTLETAGCKLEVGRSTVTIAGVERIRPLEVQTLPFPGFPTDLQQPFGALCSTGSGTSIITETLYENRFRYTNELIRMGADIVVEGRSAIIRGVPKLTGAQVQCTDLRAGAAMLLAGLAAEGETQVTELHHLDRGYENIVEKLRGLGASITREGSST